MTFLKRHHLLPFSLPLLLPFVIPFLLLPLLLGCSGYHHQAGYVSPQKRGLPGQSVDAVVKNIQPSMAGEDVMNAPGTNGTKQTTFEVFMMPLPDQSGYTSEAGLVTLTGNDNGDLL